MSDIKQFTREEFLEIVGQENAVWINRWLARGDGAAVYQNCLLEKGNTGDYQTVSYGSPPSYIESEEPPERLSDVGNRINWRYWLIGIYRGEQL